MRVLRERRLSGAKAAKLAGVAEPYISRIRTASLDRFTIDRLVRILNSLDRQVRWRSVCGPAARPAGSQARRSPERQPAHGPGPADLTHPLAEDGGAPRQQNRRRDRFQLEPRPAASAAALGTGTVAQAAFSTRAAWARLYAILSKSLLAGAASPLAKRELMTAIGTLRCCMIFRSGSKKVVSRTDSGATFL
jgi:hypothetical protein